MRNLSLRAMADAVGLKKSTVGEHKAAGMPMHSVEAAQDWLRKSVNVRKAVTRTCTQAPALACEEAPPLTPELGTLSAPGAESSAAGNEDAGAGPSVESADFDSAMMREDAALVLEARKQVVAAMKSGDAATLNFALSTYAKLSKELVAARLRWMESQEKAGRLLDLDECLAAITPHVAEVRRAFVKLGDRCAFAANPANPQMAKAIIDEAVDATFAGFVRIEASAAKAFRPKGGA